MRKEGQWPRSVDYRKTNERKQKEGRGKEKIINQRDTDLGMVGEKRGSPRQEMGLHFG